MFEAMPSRSHVRKVFVRAMGGTFLAYHMLAVAVANLSTNTKVRDLPHRWFRPYTMFFGQWQEWDMFTTIPYYATIRPTLVATSADNGNTDYGPWLPELRPIPQSLKVTSLFARVMWSRNVFSDAIARWEQSACKAIRTQAHVLPKTVHLRLETERLNPLHTVRSSGKIARPEQFNTKPTVCQK
jgi:hypothetical protein